MGTNTFLFASDDMSDEMAYRVAETIWNNLDRFQRTHSLLQYMRAETVGKGMVVPLHPGARKFFEGQGIDFAESALQD